MSFSNISQFSGFSNHIGIGNEINKPAKERFSIGNRVKIIGGKYEGRSGKITGFDDRYPFKVQMKLDDLVGASNCYDLWIYSETNVLALCSPE